MASASTIYLKGPWAPGGRDWDQGIVEKNGREYSVQDSEHGERRTYPEENVARVQWNTGWR